MVGTVNEALVESKTENEYLATLDNGKNVILQTSENIKIPSFVNVRVNSIDRNKLICSLVK